MMAALLNLPEPIAPHPAQYTTSLLPVFARMLAGAGRILDPFGGKGSIFKLSRWLPDAHIDAVEIEPEWARADPRITLGDALALPWADATFDAINTSPTYANRMADHHEARDDTRRMTYRHMLGRALHPNNSGQMQWGDRYRAFHTQAWTEARRVLRPGGRFVLNVKDHIRAGQRQRVTDWHIEAVTGLGFALLEHHREPCPGNRYGANRDLRLDYESVLLFRLEE